MNLFPFDRRLFPGLVVILAVSVFLFFALGSKLVLLVGLGFLIFQFSFFRDFRNVPLVPEGSILSAADGKITDITAVSNPFMMNEPALRIGIFLSIFDAHVTSAPFAGHIKEIVYKPGQFLNALKAESAEFNESNWIKIETVHGTIVVRQISGAIARRIYCDVKIGEHVQMGNKLGIICYGSRVEMYFPQNKFEPKVKLGDRLLTGKSVVGTWKA